MSASERKWVYYPLEEYKKKIPKYQEVKVDCEEKEACYSLMEELELYLNTLNSMANAVSKFAATGKTEFAHKMISNYNTLGLAAGYLNGASAVLPQDLPEVKIAKEVLKKTEALSQRLKYDMINSLAPYLPLTPDLQQTFQWVMQKYPEGQPL